MKNYALFSVKGRFIGFTNFKPLNGLYKEMPESFDPVQQVYVGDYETGSLKNIEDLEVKDYREANVDKKWKVFESDIDRDVYRIITENENYPLHKQLNIIMEALDANKDKLNLPEQFLTMFAKISEIRHKHANSLKTFKQAPKAEVIEKGREGLFFEEYTQQQLNILEEPVRIELVETSSNK